MTKGTSSPAFKAVRSNAMGQQERDVPMHDTTLMIRRPKDRSRFGWGCLWDRADARMGNGKEFADTAWPEPSKSDADIGHASQEGVTFCCTSV